MIRASQDLSGLFGLLTAASFAISWFSFLPGAWIVARRYDVRVPSWYRRFNVGKRSWED